MKTPTPTLKSFKVTDIRFRTHGSGRYISDGFNVYPSSNLTKLIDDFFYENSIHSLNFKSKAWTKLKNLVAKIEGKDIHKNMNLAGTAVVRYSHKAGCSCGCSPGFQARKVGSLCDLRNRDVCATLKYDLKEFRKALPAFKEMLITEIQSH